MSLLLFLSFFANGPFAWADCETAISPSIEAKIFIKSGNNLAQTTYTSAPGAEMRVCADPVTSGPVKFFRVVIPGHSLCGRTEISCYVVEGVVLSSATRLNTIAPLPTPCPDCQAAENNSANPILLPGIGTKYNQRCLSYIDSNGNFGTWGQSVLNAIERAGNSCFYDPGINLSNVCPGFSNFDLNKKKIFWVWVFAAIGMEEASCNPNISNSAATNGTADGMYQLEYSASLRRGAGRDRELCRTHESIDTRDMTFQNECAASIFRDINCEKNIPLGSSGGYWQKLNGRNRAISERIKEFPGC